MPSEPEAAGARGSAWHRQSARLPPSGPRAGAEPSTTKAHVLAGREFVNIQTGQRRTPATGGRRAGCLLPRTQPLRQRDAACPRFYSLLSCSLSSLCPGRCPLTSSPAHAGRSSSRPAPRPAPCGPHFTRLPRRLDQDGCSPRAASLAPPPCWALCSVTAPGRQGRRSRSA